MVFLTASFGRGFHAKRLELKSLKGQTTVEKLGARGPELSPDTLTLPRIGLFRPPQLGPM
jgi:hypothetical protein